MKVLIFFVIVFCFVSLSGYKAFSNNQLFTIGSKHRPKTIIYLKELSYQIYNPSLKKIIIKKYNDTSYIKLLIYSYSGRLMFEIFNPKFGLITKGYYASVLHKSFFFINDYDVSTGKLTPSKKECYQPMPFGVWKYYSNNKVIKEENYVNGINVMTKGE